MIKQHALLYAAIKLQIDYAPIKKRARKHLMPASASYGLFLEPYGEKIDKKLSMSGLKGDAKQLK